MKYNEINNPTLKKEVLTYFFDRINYYDYRYIMLKNMDDFKKNEKNIEYVIPHIKGESCFLVFCTMNRKESCFLIEKRKLKFNLNSCEISEIKICSVSCKSSNNKTYLSTIFDCRVVNQNSNNIILIQDCYYLDGVKMNAMKIERKINHIYEYISRYMKESNLKIRKVDHIKDIEELDKKITLSSVEINGFIFFQGRSGISYIFIDNENFSKNINSNQIEQVLDNNVNKFKLSFNNDELVFLLKKDAKPDVYHIYDKDDKLIHFASIPDIKTSQMCYQALKNTDAAYFKCEMCPRWKRYKPVHLVS